MAIGDFDSKVLETAAAASAHAYEQAIVHIGEEIKARDPSNLTALVGSLADEGPYAYTIMPQVSEDGSVRLPVLTTREEIAEAYAFIRGLSDLHEVIGLTEIRGAWYVFQDNISRGSRKGTDQINNNQTLGLFPSGAGPGITGELVWVRVPRDRLGAPGELDTAPEDPLLARRQVYDQYDRYLSALRANDVAAVLEVLHDGGASAIRDYVSGSAGLVELTGHDEHRSWYEALFATYEITEVQQLCQVTDVWYVFAELRVTARELSSGNTVAFNTAEFHMPSRDGRFIARIGHGTDPV